MSMTLQRTPVAQTVLGVTSQPKGYAALCAAGLFGAVVLGLPLSTIAQPSDGQSLGITAQGPGAPSLPEPVQLDSSIKLPVAADAAKATVPRTGSVRNSQAAFEQMLAGQDAAMLKRSLNSREVPWVLTPEAHPWPLRYQEPMLMSNLHLRTPDPRDVRIMLPGVAADEAETARFTANKFVVDAIALGAQARGRQLEEITQWVERTKEQLKLVDMTDPWQAYQFTLEAHRELTEFQQKITSQSEPSINAMADQIRQAIAQIAPVMDASEAYDLRMSWYNIMVLLKEGLSLYQTQILGADKQVLDLIEQFKNEHPLAERPEGPLPLTPEQAQAKKVAANATLAQMPTAEIKAQRSPAPEPLAVDSQGSGFMGGLIVAVVALIAGAGVFFTIFRRNKGKSSKPLADS